MNPKRLALLLCVHFLASASNAQVINGSFEDLNGFSLNGWSGYVTSMPMTGGGTLPINEGAPGWGSWSAAPHASQTYNYWMDQQVEPLGPGDIYVISFWAKCPGQYSQCACVYLNGSNNPSACTNEADWTEVMVTDTVPDTGSLGIRFRTRSTGLTGNQNPTPAYIDGVGLQVIGHVEVQENQIAEVFFFDAESRVLRMRSKGNLDALRICDASGRVVQRFGPLPAGVESFFALHQLTPGPYIAIAEGMEGYQSLKLVVH